MTQLPTPLPPPPPPPRMPSSATVETGGPVSQSVDRTGDAAVETAPVAPMRTPSTPAPVAPVTPAPAKAPVPARAKARRRAMTQEEIVKLGTSPEGGTSDTIPASSEDGPPAGNESSKPTGPTEDENRADMLKVLENLRQGKSGRDGLDQPDGETLTQQPPTETPPTQALAPSELDDLPEDGASTETERLAKARQALKNWQWPDDVLDGLPPATIIERGEAAADSQANFNRVANQKAEAETLVHQVLQQMGINVNQLTAPVAPAASSIPAPATGLDPSDLSSQLDTILQPLKDDELFEGVADEVKNKILGLIPTAPAPVQPVVPEPLAPAPTQAPPDTAMARLQKDNEEVHVALTRTRLTSEIPQLSDENVFAGIEDQMFKLAELPGYHHDGGKPKYDMLMRDAAAIVLNATKPRIDEDQLAASHERQTVGQPSDFGELDDPQGHEAMTGREKQLLAIKLLGQRKMNNTQIQAYINSIPDK